MKIWLAALVLTAASALIFAQSALAQEVEENGIGGVVKEKAKGLKEADLTERTQFHQGVLEEVRDIVPEKAYEGIDRAMDASSDPLEHKGSEGSYQQSQRPASPQGGNFRGSSFRGGGMGRGR